ncbi:hypothetical protein D9611_001217 [Ephemerocybe angulata]|uniref:Uncharacterized protein n=1 Tax=Ephemerocybe angulata TaxID=980116 RepID=A0A8H5CHP3_9AGAR|nr:hypothetical protein D9611_001217 [Tulosesus angulatus]
MPVLVNGTPAEAIYDPELPQSTICDTFSEAYSRTTDGSCYPELTMIADCGFSFAFRLRLVVGHAHPSAQLLLGSDWRLLIPPLAVHPISMTFSNTSVDLVSPSSIAPPIAPPPQTGTSLVSPSYSSPPSLSPGPAVHYDLPTLLLPSAIRPHIPPVFSTTVSEIHALLYDHNIKFSLVSSIETCRDLAVHHLVHGACALQPQSPPGCQAIRRSHQAPLEVSNTVVELCVNSKMCIDHLERVVQALQFTDAVVSSTQIAPRRKHATRVLQQYLKYLSARPLDVPRNPDEILDSLDRETFKKRHLQEVASMHGIRFVYQTSTDKLRSEIADHLCRGECVLGDGNAGCEHVVAVYHSGTGIPIQDDIRFGIFGAVTKAGSVHPIRRVLSANNIPYKSSETLRELRKTLSKHTTKLQEANRARGGRRIYTSTQVMQQISSAKEQWPQLIQERDKDKLVTRFRQMTSTASLKSFTCTSCAEDHLMESHCELVFPSEDGVFTKVLQHPGFTPDNPAFPHPLPEVLARTVSYAFLHPSGLRVKETEIALSLCADCANHLRRRKLPPLALANQTYIGEVPEELKDLTVVEEAMISRSRAKCWIIRLKEINHTLDVSNTQRGMKGHVIVFPQRPSEIARILPPPIEDVITPICVIFIGSKPPSQEWLREKAKPLLVRKEKVQNALVWLKAHNPLYRNIKIDHHLLGQLDPVHLLPFNIQHILPSTESDTATSRYDAAEVEGQEVATPPPDIPFQNVVVTDVDARAPIHELRAAAIRHFKRRGGGYVQIPHDAEPVNEFFDPDLLPMIYPTLFPYGIGGLENRGRKAALSFKRHVKHLLTLHDSRFQEHYSFPFTVFNILQRRAILLHTSLKVKRSNFKKVAASFASVSPEVLQSVSEKIGKGTYSFHTPEERQALDLMKEVKLVTSNVPASSSSKLVMRNEIKALIIDKGLPSFYLTINPADVYNPLVRLLAGADIDVDNLLDHQMSNYWDQSSLIAKNPAVAAKFFNIIIKAFIQAILGYDPKGKDIGGGILGVISAYYGCVEAQGRGTLHCHMLVWLDGALNPDEIKQKIFRVGDTTFQERLLAFLDDTISTSVPDDPGDTCPVEVPSAFHHPCSVRGVNLEGLSEDAARLAKQKDTHHLATQCQRHTHSKTCYKYWRGPPHPKECRFNLEEGNTRLVSGFDKDTEELSLRCLDGLVNNYNDTILRAVRCNMDIKFIGSGNTAKAVCYYITDYITKSQLKTHVAFAALELALRKLGEYDPNEDDLQMRGKRLLQRCAYSMVSHQELSAQQAVSYLMGFEDHFTSHQYRNLYWTSFERLVDEKDPLGYAASHNKTEAAADNTLELDDDIEGSGVEDEGNSDDKSQFSDEMDEIQPEDENEDEVGVRVDGNTGELILRTSQVNDYLLRGDRLRGLSLWDFVAQVDKVVISRVHRQGGPVPEESSENEENNEDMEWEASTRTASAADMLLDTHRLRPRSQLKESHPDSQTHFLRVRLPTQRYVPVPIGPAIPRRDSAEPKDHERYSRLMLILFKPWQDLDDLRESSSQPWAEALSDFRQHCSPANLSRMDNMQVLHECKDSRDDHFARRSKEKWRSGFARGMGGEHQRNSGNRDDFADETDEYSAILDHLESIEKGANGRLQLA